MLGSLRGGNAGGRFNCADDADGADAKYPSPSGGKEPKSKFINRSTQFGREFLGRFPHGKPFPVAGA